jgi:signal transduction histidine kinase
VTEARARTLAWGSFAISAALCVGTLVFIVLAWSVPVLPNEFGFRGYGIAFSLVTGGVGAVIASRRSDNAIGWILCGIGVLAAVVIAFGAEYARWALIQEGGRPPGGLYAAWLQEWAWMPTILGLAIVAWIFPDGRFLSRTWRAGMVVAVVLSAIPLTLNAVLPRLTIFAGFRNPLGIDASWIQGAANGASFLLLPTIVGGVVAAARRFRHGSMETRQQIKWLVLSVGFVGAALLYYVTAITIGGAGQDPVGSDPFGKVIEYLAIASFLGVPISIGLGVLKYRLYDIDVVINKAVVYGALAVFITVVYVAVVVGVGTAVGAAGDPLLSAVAAAVVALAFQPARRASQRLANRVVYGRRATPYEVLAELGDRLAGEYASEDVLDRIAATLAGGIGAERVVVWLHVGSDLRPAASWPGDGRAPATVGDVIDTLPRDVEGMRPFPVRHQGELLGAIGVSKPASDPITEADERLVTDLAGQAGLVLRNARLIEDLRASRQRLVAAQDLERRRIERNIHDGAQQQLVALAVKMRLADAMIGKDEARAHELIAQLQAETTDAIDTLRDLARGIYPPLLADQGLVAALNAQARKSAVPVEISPDGVTRYPQEIEAATYFCVLEAIQNVAKYANATRARVDLRATDGGLTFTVEDDGVGFDGNARRGSGLTNMQDRVDALGGRIDVRSAPGRGTVVAGWLPLEVPVR